MRKITAGLICVLLAVLIAVISVGCSKGEELTYTGDSQSSSSDNQLISSELPSQVTIPNSTENTANTIIYELTTQQGETAQVIQTTEPTTIPPTMNYDPVTVPVMPTEYVTSTTQYVAPTYSGSEQGQVSTQPSSQQTTEGTTEPKRVYKEVHSATGGLMSDGTIAVDIANADELFTSKIKSNKGTAVVNIDNVDYTTNYKVSTGIDSDNIITITVSANSEIKNAISMTSSVSCYVKIPKDAVVDSKNNANKAFYATVML